jgi:hypothetical protein
VLWNLNRFSPGKACQKGSSAKTLLLTVIDVVLLVFARVIVVRGDPLFKTESFPMQDEPEG